MPPEFTTLATFHIPLAEFMEGEFEFGTVFTKDGDETKSVKSQAIEKVRQWAKFTNCDCGLLKYIPSYNPIRYA